MFLSCDATATFAQMDLAANLVAVEPPMGSCRFIAAAFVSQNNFSLQSEDFGS